MSIKQSGGVFGRNPTFNDVTIDGTLTFDGDIDINSDLKVNGDIEATRLGINIDPQVDIHIANAVAVEIKMEDTGASTSHSIIADGIGLSLRADSAYNDVINVLGGTAHQIAFRTNGADAFIVDAAGNIAFQAGKGIDFSATSGTGTSELLDDYEEGTFTPSSFTNWASTSITPGGSASYSGSYTKIGRTVTCYVDINLNTSGTSVAVGDIWSVAGLPYTSSGDFISGGGVLTVYGSLGSNILAQIAVSTKGTTAYFRPIQVTGAVNYAYPIRGFFVFSV